MSANSRQVGGRHYKALKPEPWDVMLAWGLNGPESFILKYLARWRRPGGKGVEDLRKLIHCAEKLIEQVGKD